MITEVIRSLYDHSTWANQRIFSATAELTQEQFLEEVGPSYGSLWNTFVHTMSGQWIWLERWRGSSSTALLDQADFPDLSFIRSRWEEIKKDTRQYLERLKADQLDNVISYTTIGGSPGAYPLWQLIVQQVNHQTQHRSEAAVMLTNFGHSPGDLDLVVYFSELKS